MTLHDCGHVCCDERGDPLHNHFLDPATCPSCARRRAEFAGDAPEPPAQHIGDGNDPGRPFRDLMDSGMLWLINTSVFHPRGLALALNLDRTTSDVVGWHLAAADGEPFRYAVPAELDDPSRAPDLDALYRAAQITLDTARKAHS